MKLTINISTPKFNIGDYIEFKNKLIAEVYDYEVELNFSLRNNKNEELVSLNEGKPWYVLVVQKTTTFCSDIKPSTILFLDQFTVESEAVKVIYNGTKYKPKAR
jgi:hypothetical protein